MACVSVAIESALLWVKVLCVSCVPVGKSIRVNVTVSNADLCVDPWQWSPLLSMDEVDASQETVVSCDNERVDIKPMVM